jgi:hypothetical protein
METSAPAAVPWIVLGVAVLALAGLAGLWLTRRPAPPAPVPAPAEPRPVAAGHGIVRYPDDDLPGFRDAPPGTPGAAPAPRPPAVPWTAAADDVPVPTPEDLPSAARAVAAMAATALVLVAALAGVAAAGRDDAPPQAPAARTPDPLPPVTTAPTSTAPLPELPGIPADPLPGEGGAGVYANRSVPLGEDGVTARLTFGGIVVERYAVGVSVGYPSVSLTATGEPGSDGYAALAHLRVPTWNCLAAEPPADPLEAGCVRSTTEYADLPSPALTVVRDGEELRVTGRFPAYSRPVATAPAYTGRVYDLTVTASPGSRVRDGRAAADATLFLGTDRVSSVDLPGLNVVGYAG